MFNGLPAVGGKFKDLARVPLRWKDNPRGDCTAFPTRPGFTDFPAVFKVPGSDPAWTAAVDSEAGHL